MTPTNREMVRRTSVANWPFTSSLHAKHEMKMQKNMKTKQQSGPPAVAGGLTEATTTATASTDAVVNDPKLQPPATAGGPDLAIENEQLKETLRIERAHRQITGELARNGARSPELLFDAVRGELQFDDDGAVANAAAIVGKLKASHPEQFGPPTPPSIDAGAGRAVAPPLTREALAKMKPAEIAELDWNEVRRVLSNS